MDRFTWGVVGTVLALAAAAFAMVAIGRSTPETMDLATPEGTVRAYLAAVYDRRADDAWRLLAGPEAVNADYGRTTPTTEQTFRRQVESQQPPSSRRARILGSRESADGRIIVDVEIVSGSDGPWPFAGRSSTRRVTFSLRQIDGQWRMVAAPAPWEIR